MRLEEWKVVIAVRTATLRLLTEDEWVEHETTKLGTSEDNVRRDVEADMLTTPFIKWYIVSVNLAKETVALEDNRSELRKRFDEESAAIQFPTHLVTLVKLPGGAIETAVNTDGLKGKLAYIAETYDHELYLKSNRQVQMKGFVLI